MTTQDAKECCPKFEPGPWEDKQISWEGKLFLKDHVRSFLHMPLNFSRVMRRDMARIAAAGAAAAEPLVLTDEKSLWGADLYIAITKDIAGVTTTKLSGSFVTKVFEGPYRNLRGWIREMKAFVRTRGKALQRMLFFYTTCPKCARKYGKNYVVILAQV